MSVMSYVQPRTRNSIGNVALGLSILGGVAVAAAILFVPAVLYVAVPLLAVALVLSIVGLTRTFAKGSSIAALVLSVVLGAAAPVVWGVANVLSLLQH